MTAATTSMVSTAAPLRRGPASVHGEDRARHVAGGVGGEVEAGCGDVAHVASPADGDAVLEQVAPELRHALANGGVDGAGGHDVDADLVLDQLHSGGPREKVQ